MFTKKRKIDEEGRVVQPQWKNLYFCIELSGRPTCLICNKVVSVCKSYNVRRHYKTNHAAEYDGYCGQARENKVAELEEAFRKQQQLHFHLECDYVAKTGYKIAHEIAKTSRPFSDGNFIKKCLLMGIEAICPRRKQALAALDLSENAIAERVIDIADDLSCQLKDKVKNFLAFSVAIDDCTDLNNVKHLAVFIRGVDFHSQITEEFVELVPMKEMVTDDEVCGGVVAVLDRLGVNWAQAVSLATDGAQQEVSRNAGIISKLKEKLKNVTPDHEFYYFHCILHQDMSGKALKMDHITDVVVKIIGFIRIYGHDHKQFSCFMEESESPQGSPYRSDILWANQGVVLKHFYDVRDLIQVFLADNGKATQELEDKEWLQDLAFLVDITEHLKNMNANMKMRKKLVTDYYDCIRGFEIKLHLWEKQLSGNDMAHFPTLKSLLVSAESPCHAQTGKYAVKISELRTKLQARLSDLTALEQGFELFQNPVSIRLVDVKDDMRLEIIRLQCDSDLKAKFAGADVDTFYQHADLGKRYPKLHLFASKILSMFGNTYICDQVIAVMNMIKSRFHGHLTNTHLNSIIKVATAQSLTPDFNELVPDRWCKTQPTYLVE